MTNNPDTGLSSEQARIAWTKGFRSSNSLCESALKEILKSAHFVHGRQVYEITPEVIDMQLSKIERGMYKEMRIAEKAGLDYYFAQSTPKTILGGKAV